MSAGNPPPFSRLRGRPGRDTNTHVKMPGSVASFLIWEGPRGGRRDLGFAGGLALGGGG